MFADTSAIIAIPTHDPDAEDLIDRLEAVSEPIASAVAISRAPLGLCRNVIRWHCVPAPSSKVPIRGHSGLEFNANRAYPAVMDDPLPPAPPGWLEALAESEAELAAGKTVPSEPIMQRLRETIARLEAKRAGATAPTDTSRR